MPEVPWSGIEFLDTVSGPSERYPPLRVLFLAHRVAASGRLLVRTSQSTRSLHLSAGRVVAVSGFPSLLDALELIGSPTEDMVTLVGRAVALGHPPDRAIEAAVDGLGRSLASLAELRGAEVRFEREAEEPRARLPVQESLPRLIARGLRQVRSADRLRTIFAPRLRNPVRLSVPDDSPEHRWGLDPVASRLLREIARGATLGELLGSGGSNEPAYAMDLLLQLGLAWVDGLAASARPTAPPRSPERRLAELRSVEPLAAPRATAAPAELEAVTALRAALEAMEGAAPAAVLGLTRAADLTEAGVERAFRELSVRYHPDRHPNASPAVKELTVRCFGRVSDAATALRDPAARNEAQARLQAQEEGRVYVGESDVRAARVAFARGEIALRARRFAEALPDLEEAARRDPGSWRYEAFRVQAAAMAGRIGAKEAESLLAPLVGRAPAGAARADLLYTIGELLLREGQEAAAKARFEAALVEHPEHVGAKRRVWLQKRRGEDVEPTRGGLLDGLLNRKR